MNNIIFLAADTAERNSGESMKDILQNIVMGFGIVFILLLIIIGIVSLYRYISKAEAGLRNKREVINSVQTISQGDEPIKEEIDGNLADDLELVAVITAAIQAYEEANGNPVSSNGLYVRSIRKVNKSRWQNA